MYPYNGEETKKAWARSVKVGDIICNCSYKHLRVIEKLPCCDKDVNNESCDCNVYDIMVTLENGTLCNLMNCADAVPHPEGWHSKALDQESKENLPGDQT